MLHVVYYISIRHQSPEHLWPCFGFLPNGDGGNTAETYRPFERTQVSVRGRLDRGAHHYYYTSRMQMCPQNYVLF